MKPPKVYLLFVSLAITATILSCAQKQQRIKITDIPVTTSSKEAMASFRQGMTLFDQGEGQKARTFFIKAIEQDPKLAVGYLMKSNTDVSNQEFADDISKAKANINGTSNWEKWYCDLYETFLTSDWNKRLQITKTIADSFPDAPRAQVDLGFTYFVGNDATNARECFQKAVNLDSNSVSGYSALSNSYLFLDPKDFKKAEMYALKAVLIAPSSPGAKIALGDCYRAQNDLQKARDAYSKAVSLDPGSPEAYYKMGHANTFMGNYDEARQNYMDGGNHDLSKTAANQYTAYTYLYRGDHNTALKWLMEQATKIDSSGELNAKISSEKLAYLGDCERIAIHYGDVNQLNELMTIVTPLNTQAANDIGTQEAKIQNQATDEYLQSLLAAMEGNYEDAKAKAEQCKKTLEPITDPNKLNFYHFSLGYIAMKQKNYGDAVNHFQESNPNLSVYNKYWLAVANEAAGNKDQANAQYKEVSEYNFNGIDYALIRNEVKNKARAM
ncbi:MAG: tetratricopeptide repeat protein [Chitinophagales bacterium]|nr:tetratricopeptide repeat protein [Chitinophagales bacterium]